MGRPAECFRREMSLCWGDRLTSASTTKDMDARNYSGAARNNDGDRQFRAATRHSRRVRVLRWAIPLSILAMFGMIIFATWFNPLRMLAKLPIDPGKLLISGTKITMEAPKLAGFTRDARPYALHYLHDFLKRNHRRVAGSGHGQSAVRGATFD